MNARAVPIPSTTDRNEAIAAVVCALIPPSTLAFGAVHSWGYVLLFVAAACVGAVTITRNRGVAPSLRYVSIGLFFIVLAITGQLIPVRRSILAALSPQMPSMLLGYTLGFASSSHHALSIDPNVTARGLGAVVALGAYTVGLAGILSRRTARILTQGLMGLAWRWPYRVCTSGSTITAWSGDSGNPARLHSQTHSALS